jgi:hypothetical protein
MSSIVMPDESRNYLYLLELEDETVSSMKADNDSKDKSYLDSNLVSS